MVDQDLFADIVSILRRLASEGSAETISETTMVRSDLDVDSNRFVEFTIELEDTFDVRIRDAEASEIETVGDAVRLVSRLVTAKHASVTA